MVSQCTFINISLICTEFEYFSHVKGAFLYSFPGWITCLYNFLTFLLGFGPLSLNFIKLQMALYFYRVANHKSCLSFDIFLVQIFQVKLSAFFSGYDSLWLNSTCLNISLINCRSSRKGSITWVIFIIVKAVKDWIFTIQWNSPMGLGVGMGGVGKKFSKKV